MPAKTITVIGSLNTDLVSITARVPSRGETLTGTSFHTGAGGKGANQAVAAARLSRSNPHSKTKISTSKGQDELDIVVKMVGAVGNDEFGPKLIAGMKEDGIDVEGIAIVEDQPTGVAVIIVESTTGDNRILLNPGANSSLLPSSIPSPLTPTPTLLILQLEIPLPTILQIIHTSSTLTPPTPILLNPAPAVPLPENIYPFITHLILNESEAALLTGRSVDEVEKPDFKWEVVAAELIARGVTNVVVTLGSKGAFWASCTSSATKTGFVPAQKVDQVVDTTAAGDTFVGAYAVAVVRAEGEGKGELDLESVVRWACKASARTVQKQGAQSSIPWADEL